MMKKPFCEVIKERVLLADGGMGSEIYKRGFFINRSYDQLNLSAAKVIQEIHHAFAKAGAEVLTTNTFAANRIALNAHGLADQVEAINRAGVELAKEIAGDELYVAGSIGPVLKTEDYPDWPDALAEQAAVLEQAGADVLVLEAFTSTHALQKAFITLHERVNVPVIPTLSFSALDGLSAESLVDEAKTWGAECFGVVGGDPEDVLKLTPELVRAAGDTLKIMVRPSAGNAKEVEGRTLYLASPEYMAEYTRRYVQKGAGMIGGDAGITPDMVKEMSSFLRAVQPRQPVQITDISEPEAESESVDPVPIEERTRWGRDIGNKFCVSVELDLPKGLDVTKSVNGAKFLYENGIDAVNIADGPRASGRMSPTALAQLVQRECDIETIIHVCCRDRNLLALQMDLISANSLELRNLMLITGDPPKMGIYPDATAVFDLDAIGLVRNAHYLNHGLDFAKRPLKGQTEFVIGTGCNPGAVDLDLEVSRYQAKVDAGAEFVFSQPVYDPTYLQTFLGRIDGSVKAIPFFVGILPLASYKNAEFLHTQVPGMQIPDEIRERMRKASTKEEQRQEGINIAAEALEEAIRHPLVKGAYIFPPFGRYSAILEVLEKAGAPTTV